MGQGKEASDPRRECVWGRRRASQERSRLEGGGKRAMEGVGQ